MSELYDEMKDSNNKWKYHINIQNTLTHLLPPSVLEVKLMMGGKKSVVKHVSPSGGGKGCRDVQTTDKDKHKRQMRAGTYEWKDKINRTHQASWIEFMGGEVCRRDSRTHNVRNKII
jgi:hypothetical protein